MSNWNDQAKAEQYTSRHSVEWSLSQWIPFEIPETIIATASYEDYVKPLFGKSLILGARLAYKDDGFGTAQEFYGAQKVNLLREQGIEKSWYFYTDSFSDQAVMDISETVYLVKK